MGRELQKSKNRSGRAKVRRDTKSNRKIFNNPIIAANYDPKQTLSQNYRRLGLATKLNNPTGGTEKTASTVAQDTPTAPPEDALAIASRNKLPTEVAAAETRVERDPATGKILRIVPDDADPSAPPRTQRAAAYTPLHGPLNDLDPAASSDSDEFHGFDDPHAAAGFVGKRALHSNNPILQQLEAQVARLQGQPKSKRKQSEREVEWVRALVAAHGDDFVAMARDRRLNVMQQSVGDVRRRVRKYLDG